MKRIAGSIAMALGLIGGAQAATVTYDFTVTNPFGSDPATVAGVFSYDDQATPLVSDSNSATYLAQRLSLGGTDSSYPYFVLQRQSVGVAAFISATFPEYYFLTFFFKGEAFTSLAADQLNGKSLSDLVASASLYGNRNDLNAVKALSQRSADVPVSATLALLGLGLAGIGAARRKQA
jgi:hypothetical protein